MWRDGNVGADILARHQHQLVAQQILAGVVLDQALVVEIIHPVEIGGDEDIRAARRFDLARQDRRGRQRHRHLLAALLLIIGGDLLQGIGERGRAEHRDVRGEGRQRRQRQQQGCGQRAQKFFHESPYDRRDARVNITFSRGAQNPCPVAPLRVRMTRMAGLFLRLPIGDSGNLGPGKGASSGADRGDRLDPRRRHQDEAQLSPRLAAAAGHRKGLWRLDPGPADGRQGGRRRRPHGTGAATSSSISAMPNAAPRAPSRPTWTRWRN